MMSLLHGTAAASRKMAVADLLVYSEPMHHILQPACKAIAKWKAAQQQPSMVIDLMERKREIKQAVTDCDMERLHCPCEVQNSDVVSSCIVC